jgi:membrane protein YqaA with SNARE-associated domain
MMLLVRRLYDWVLHWAQTPYGLWALVLLSFAESSFFPIPPDVLLIALAAGLPKRAWRFAAACTVASVAGGMFGYAIGHFLWYSGSEFSTVARLFFDYVPGFTEPRFASVGKLFEEWNFWVVFTAGFTPIPYKLITISAGVFQIDFLIFIVASAVGRAGRFFLVGGLIYFFGEPIKRWIDKWFNTLVWAFTALLLGGFLAIKYVL